MLVLAHNLTHCSPLRMCWMLLLVVSGTACWDLSADEVILRSGGRVHGFVLGEEGLTPSGLVGTTERGIHVTLPTSEVSDTVRESPAMREYRRIAPQSGNSVEAQWVLAEWCRAQSLKRQREVHLRQILTLEPGHADARRALGYSLIDGRWSTKREHMAERGYRYFEGRWRLPQEIELIVERRQREREAKQWVVRLRRWRKHLDLRDAGAAIKAIRLVRHPAAVPAITQLYASETTQSVKLLLLETLVQIDAGSAAAALIRISLDEDDEEVRLACLDHVLRRKPPTALAAYVAALSGSDSTRVNRAAQTLAQLQDSSAVGPLIEALVTEHHILVTDPSGRSSESVTTTFSSDGPGFSVGNRDRVFVETVANNEVLAALVQLTDGANYYFDQDAWRSWYEAQRQAITFNGRR